MAADKFSESMQQIVYVARSGWCCVLQKFSGQSESRPVHRFGGTSVDIRLECRPNSEKDDRKVINPVLAVGMRHEGGFELPM